MDRMSAEQYQQSSVPGKKVFRKYKNRPRTVDGIWFPSEKEASRWLALKLLQQAFHISDLKRQVVFRFSHNGHNLGSYRADFTYLQDGRHVVEDCKGFRTPEYIQKRKMMMAFHGVEIFET